MDLCKNTLIRGRVGYGKTSILKNIIKNKDSNTAIVVLDPTGNLNYHLGGTKGVLFVKSMVQLKSAIYSVEGDYKAVLLMIDDIGLCDTERSAFLGGSALIEFLIDLRYTVKDVTVLVTKQLPANYTFGEDLERDCVNLRDLLRIEQVYNITRSKNKVSLVDFYTGDIDTTLELS